ncbi:MAG: hypothetical protein QOF21_1605 [Actinomycetota bacterium]
MVRFAQVVACVTLVVLASCAGATDERRTRATDPQWSGYVSVGRTFNEVSARFVVPSVSCPEPNMNASFWVGLDGFDTPTVEQIGVEALCRDGSPRYSAWWQAYPRASEPLDLVVEPGDEITVRVAVRATGVSFELRNRTSLRSFEKTVGAAATFASAEVIAEQSGATQGPLSNFGEVVFYDATVDGEPVGQAKPRAVVMSDASDSPRIALSPLAAAGDSFAVTWLAP